VCPRNAASSSVDPSRKGQRRAVILVGVDGSFIDGRSLLRASADEVDVRTSESEICLTLAKEPRDPTVAGFFRRASSDFNACNQTYAVKR